MLDNIELNGCTGVIPHNFGLCDIQEGKYGISRYVERSRGQTSFAASDDGEFSFKRIDDLNFSEKIDLIKMDVEGMEINVVNGALNTLKRDRPFLWIEEWDEDSVQEKFKVVLDMGYGLMKCGKDNFFFIPQ